MEVNIHEAKTHLSRLLRRVAEGEEITIARAGVPVAKVIAVGPAKGVRPLGAMEGQFHIPEDFDAPLPDDLLALFYSEGEGRKARALRAKSPKPAKRRGR